MGEESAGAPDDARARKGASEFAVPEVEQSVGLSYLEDVEDGQAVDTVLFVRRARLYIVATQHVDLDADEGRVGSSPASKRTAKREEPAVGPGAAV